MYNWYAVNDSRGLAPAGSHIPSYEELLTLAANLGGEKVAGGKMKEEGTAHWDEPNKKANNTSGFTGLPGGYRVSSSINNEKYGFFRYLESDGSWFSSSKASTNTAWRFSMVNDKSYMSFDNNFTLQCGLSVRCIKD